MIPRTFKACSSMLKCDQQMPDVQNKLLKTNSNIKATYFTAQSEINTVFHAMLALPCLQNDNLTVPQSGDSCQNKMATTSIVINRFTAN